jgi:DNA-binding Lrp family transcriptional regulator
MSGSQFKYKADTVSLECCGKMFSLIRISVPLTRYDPGSGTSTQIIDKVWDHVAERHRSWRTNEVKPIYMTRRYLQEDTSLIVDAANSDVLAEFLLNHIATIEHVRGIWVINLAKMKFFKTPLEHHKDLSRFTVTIDATPKHLDRIYETISALKPGRDIIINYIAHTFQSPSASIMISVLARSRNHIDAFVNDYIRSQEGVVDAEITFISKTMRLASPKEWKESLGAHFVSPGGDPIKNIDVDDDSLIAGC